MWEEEEDDGWVWLGDRKEEGALPSLGLCFVFVYFVCGGWFPDKTPILSVFFATALFSMAFVSRLSDFFVVLMV